MVDVAAKMVIEAAKKAEEVNETEESSRKALQRGPGVRQG